MRYYRVRQSGEERLIARDDDGAYDLTAAREEVRSLRDLAAAASIADRRMDDIGGDLREQAAEVPIETVEADSRLPVVPDEVWAAGVTYAISEEARESESGMPEMYLDVYDAERPEIFFKATSDRTVGPREAIGIRGDSDWNVPEPELGIVLYRGSIVGYTVGNDISSRDIEGQNPLYLPQAKVYDKCCAIGPCVASPGTIDDPRDLSMSMEIVRDGESVFDGETTTGEMVRSCEELVDYYLGHDAVPTLSVLLTGTSLVPPDEFTLAAGDEVTIDIEGIGRLSNTVETV
jgi:2-dehydro-3-deoxy-D-arabinonate dehydratase